MGAACDWATLTGMTFNTYTVLGFRGRPLAGHQSRHLGQWISSLSTPSTVDSNLHVVVWSAS